MRSTWMAVALAAGLALTGCGASGGGGSAKKGAAPGAATTSVATKTSTAPKTTTTSAAPKSKGKGKSAGPKLTKSVVVTKADSACRAAKSKRTRLDRVGTAAQQIAALASQIDDPAVATYVTALQNEVGLLRRLDYARKHKQAGEVAFLRSALETTRRRARRLARGYGFQVCRSG